MVWRLWNCSILWFKSSLSSRSFFVTASNQANLWRPQGSALGSFLFNQSINQSINQPVNQSISQSFIYSFIHSFIHSFNTINNKYRSKMCKTSSSSYTDATGYYKQKS